MNSHSYLRYAAASNGYLTQANHAYESARIRDAQWSLSLPQTSSEQPSLPILSVSHGTVIAPPRYSGTPLQSGIILLHDHGGDETSLSDFTLQHLHRPGACYVLLRGISPVSLGGLGYHWGDSVSDHFIGTSHFILENLVHNVLIQKHHFRYQNIVLFG